jgi:hypothetical protein
MLPVSRGREGWFLALFLVQYVGGLVGLALLGWLDHSVSWLDAAKLVPALIITATTNAILIVEGIPMVAERYLERRFQEGEKKGREEGEKVGREEGQKTRQQLWEAWNQRRLAAEATGQPFTEPPPSL